MRMVSIKTISKEEEKEDLDTANNLGTTWMRGNTEDNYTEQFKLDNLEIIDIAS